MSNNVDVQQQGNSYIEQQEQNDTYWDNKVEEKPVNKIKKKIESINTKI